MKTQLAITLASLLSWSAYGETSLDSSGEFSSGNTRVQLVELFTSEGCSSCPPADAYLSQLLASDNLWTKYIPVAFHVDYWDYIGWEDRFALPAYSLRQRAYKANRNTRGVYTPQFVIDGNEWRGFFSPFGRTLPSYSETNGQLDAKLNNNEVSITFKTPDKLNPNQLKLHVAILGSGIETEVRRGENEGRTLRHDFVVLGHTLLSNGAVTENGLSWQGKLPTYDPKVDADRYAVAFWVSEKISKQTLQATGGWLTDSASGE